MALVLLDTSVASLFHPKRVNSPAREFFEPHMRGRIMAVSFQTQAELWAWAEDHDWGIPMRAALELLLSRFVVVPWSEELGRAWARVMADAKRAGRRLEAGDGWIAASAVLYQVPLLTQDADFSGLGVQGLEVIGPVENRST